MTTLTSEIPAMSTPRARPRPSRFERLVGLVVWIRSTAGEGLAATVARSVDEAFTAFARDLRR